MTRSLAGQAEAKALEMGAYWANHGANPVRGGASIPLNLKELCVL